MHRNKGCKAVWQQGGVLGGGGGGVAGKDKGISGHMVPDIQEDHSVIIGNNHGHGRCSAVF